MSRQIINTEKAPAAIGPYSQAVRAGNTVYFSGQIPLDPATGDIVGAGDVEAQARRAFDNLKAVAEAAGGSLDKVVRLGLYLTDRASSPRSTRSCRTTSRPRTRPVPPSKSPACRRAPTSRSTR